MTVRANVIIHTDLSAQSSRQMPRISRHSPMFHATTNSTAARVASGTNTASGAATSTMASSVSA